MPAPTPRLTPLRSILIFPAHIPKFAEKAPSSGADAICLDLEDAVPLDEKDNARRFAASLVDPQRTVPLLARVNAVQTGLAEQDLVSVARDGLDGIVLPKADSPAVVQRVDHYLTILEHERRLQPARIAILPLIETPAGILAAERILSASPRVSAALLGGEDLATDLGAQRTPGGVEIAWARARFVVSCHAAGVIPIDTPETSLNDPARLESQAALARSLGYQGKLCIHPSQVPVVNQTFAPTEAEINEARTLVQTFEREALATGRAAVQIRGKMVDTPIYQRARRLLDWAETLRHE